MFNVDSSDKEKTENLIEKGQDLKLIIDFEASNLNFESKQMQIESIKLKERTNRNLKQETVNLKDNSKKHKKLF